MNLALQNLGVNLNWGFFFTIATLILIRVSFVTTMIPFLVGKPVPGVIRLGFSIILTAFLYPYLAPANPSAVPQAPLALFLLYIKEAFYGFAIGIAASIIFHAFEGAGSMVDNQRGAAQARLLIPQLGEQTSLFGQFNFLLGVVIFLSLDGHLFFLKAFVESYDLLPLLELPKGRIDLLAMADEFIRNTAAVLVTALQLTAPVLISIFVIDVILGIVSKAAPAINVFELGFAIRGVVGVLVYFLSIGLVATQMGKLSLGMVEQVQRIILFLARPS